MIANEILPKEAFWQNLRGMKKSECSEKSWFMWIDEKENTPGNIQEDRQEWRLKIHTQKGDDYDEPICVANM